MTLPRRFVVVPMIALGSLMAGAMGVIAYAAPAPSSAALTEPVVVELFQSQGCSSCPPANDELNAIAGRADILALSFAVTYWDQLGWKDTFGSPAYTKRQQDYADAGRGEVATPEFIIDGAYPVVGSDRASLQTAIARAAARRAEVAITPDSGAGNGGGVKIGAAAGHDAAGVWLVRYDPRVLAVPVRAGENGGRTLPHRNIVRELVRLGNWSGAEAKFAFPPARDSGLASAVLIQRGTGGPIVAARKL